MKQQLSDLLKIAIETHDWDIVCKIYKSITGQDIKIPKQPKHVNKFVDDGKLVKRESVAERKLYNEPSLEHRREPVIYVDVICKCGHVDKLPSSLASSYGGDPERGRPEYKCQKCIKNLRYSS